MQSTTCDRYRTLYSHRQIENGPKVVLLNLKVQKVDSLEVLKRVNFDACTTDASYGSTDLIHEERNIVENYQLGVN